MRRQTWRRTLVCPKTCQGNAERTGRNAAGSPHPVVISAFTADIGATLRQATTSFSREGHRYQSADCVSRRSVALLRTCPEKACHSLSTISTRSLPNASSPTRTAQLSTPPRMHSCPRTPDPTYATKSCNATWPAFDCRLSNDPSRSAGVKVDFSDYSILDARPSSLCEHPRIPAHRITSHQTTCTFTL